MDEHMTFLWKASGCNAGPCPALIKGDGRYYVQHKKVTDPETRARLMKISADNGNPLAEDEDYGWVQADVIDRIREL